MTFESEMVYDPPMLSYERVEPITVVPVQVAVRGLAAVQVVVFPANQLALYQMLTWVV